MNLLQSAGFCKSNPYYIVPQGRITALTNAKDSDRLQLLKEVAGTKVYEEHREESVKIMKETEGKKEKIVELLRTIHERLDELEEEKGELEKYYELDRERRVFEFLLHTREMGKLEEEMTRLEAQYQSTIDQVGSSKEASEEYQFRLEQMESQLSDLLLKINNSKTEEASFVTELEALLQQRNILELTLDGLNSESKNKASEEERIKSLLKGIEEEIAVKEEELGQIVPQLSHMDAKESNERTQLATFKEELSNVQSKKTRLGQFRNVTERNKWLAKEKDALQKQRELNQGQFSNLSEEIESYSAKQKDLEEQMEHLLSSKEAEQVEAELIEAKRERDSATETRKELWRAQAKLESSITNITGEIERLTRSTHGSEVATIQRISGLVHRLGLQEKYHGPLYELFKIEDCQFMTATDVTGGSSLFNLVVEDDEAAATLIKALVKEQIGGRVTFIPLNRLRPDSSMDVDLDPEVATRLMDQLSFDPKYEPAIRHVFGRTFVCKDLASATSVSRTHRVDTITLQGDRVSRKGALTGGHIETKKHNSRLESLWRLTEWQMKRVEHEETLASVKSRLGQVDQQVTLALGKMQTLECRKSELDMRLKTISHTQRVLETEIGALCQIISTKRQLLLELEQSSKAIEGKLVFNEQEANGPFVSELDEQDRNRLAELEQSIDVLEADYNQLNTRLSTMLAHRNLLETELDMNLRKARQSLLSQLSAIESHRQIIVETEVTFTSVQDQVSVIETELGATRKSLKIAQLEHEALISAIESARTMLESSLDASSTDQQMTKYTSKRASLVQRQRECSDRLRALGTIPADIPDNILSLPSRTLLSRLHQVKDTLRTDYPHINKKASEQHASFCKQRDALQTRLADLDASARSISDFISVLDGRKDDAIQRTFDQVSGAFTQIFSTLVPSGHASLGMVADLEAKVYTGVSIKASFNTVQDEGLLITQLSGGQKSLVALALILAIQKTDPAPFYLFDEVDAALDAAHRTSLATLLDQLSHDNGRETQFICTTFRSELLRPADKFFGVSFGSRVSRVEEISRDQAMDFIETSQA